MGVQAKSSKSGKQEAKKAIRELQRQVKACRREARRLARRHKLTGWPVDRTDEAFGDVECGLADLLDAIEPGSP